MSRNTRLRQRVTRTGVTVVAVGFAFTAVSYAAARGFATRLDRERVDRPANAVVLEMQQLSAAVDQVLATANGVVAATDGDATRFRAALGSDVAASGSLDGIALVAGHGPGAHVVTAVGVTSLLGSHPGALLAAAGDATLVAHTRDAHAYHLLFASALASGRTVALQISLPDDAQIGATFAIVDTAHTGATADVLVANTPSPQGLTRWPGSLVVGGRTVALLVAPQGAAPALGGVPLPALLLAIGLVLTALAAFVAVAVVRRDHAVRELRSHNAELDAAIEQQRRVEAELRASHEALQASHEALRRSQRLESIGQLAGGVAHDFNNILAAILASAELLQGEIGRGRPEAYRREIERAAQRGAALTRQLLTYAHQDRSEPRSVDMGEIVTGMESLLRRAIGSEVQLQLTMPGEPGNVLADPTQLEQVVMNLALNARDAMPGGGILWISVRVDPPDERASDDGATDGARVVLGVTDTGTGIDPDVRDRMFDPFVTTKEDGKGTGLGLATVRSIADAAGARIDVTSQPGQGTTIEIAFPRCAVASEPLAGEPVHGVVARRGLRVLLVEDEGAVRAALAHLLERNGFHVAAASTANAALELLEREAVDVVVTDLVMPGRSGRDLVEHVVVHRPELPVVAMSGYTRADDGGLPRGVALLRKPFTNAQLLAAIDAALRAAASETTPVEAPTA